MKTLNRTDVVAEAHRRTGRPLNEVDEIIRAEWSTIISAVRKGEKVSYVGVGSFVKKHLKSRKGRNPQTGKPLKIQGRNIGKFKCGQGFKNALNK